jgi:sugar phosphate isomerase/epimerase
MKLSLSVRIAEGFLSKEVPVLSLNEVVDLASASGYSAICMRASQVGINSPEEKRVLAGELLKNRHMQVSMVTGDFDTVYNNDRGPSALRNIQPYLVLAQQMGSRMIRVAVKSEADIPWAQRAADQAAEFGIQLVHQCHTLSLFETVESIVATLTKIDRPNFGLIYEPANLETCGQDYGPTTLKLLFPWIFNIYLQNQILSPSGAVSLDTWCRGPVRFDLIPIHEPRGIDFGLIVRTLRDLGYHGFLTAHQSAMNDETSTQTAQRTREYLTSLL